MDTLSNIVRKYLTENGISDKFFERYIGCPQSTCSNWFSHKANLTPEQLEKTHEFLKGKHVKTIEEVLEEK